MEDTIKIELELTDKEILMLFDIHGQMKDIKYLNIDSLESVFNKIMSECGRNKVKVL
jgi:hypothetical protein